MARESEHAGKIFCNAKDEIIDAFVSMGSGNELAAEAIAGIEVFVCNLYDTTTVSSSIGDVRWKLFTKKQAEGENLPPTKGSLEQSMLRSHYISLIWRSATIPSPNLPNIADYGWKVSDGIYVPIMTNMPPAPEAVIQLIKCMCTATKCTRYCSCRRNNLACTEICKCNADEKNCDNPMGFTFESDSSDSDSD